jgi:3-oxoacyl-[acyl-carrier protein] reductase
MTEQHIQYMLSKIPMNRFGEVEEVAEMVSWLASPLCTFSTASVFDLFRRKGHLLMPPTLIAPSKEIHCHDAP